MKKIIILTLILLTKLTLASDIAGDINNDGILSGEEQYLLNNPPIENSTPIENEDELLTEDPIPAPSLYRYNSARIERDADGRIKRSSAAKNDFKQSNPCPTGKRRSGSCPGYVIDHINPLACGGADAPYNMQWQTVQAAKAKDKTERDNCQPYKNKTRYKSGTVLYDSERDINRETYSNNREIHTGPRGGRYTLSPSGNKEYIKHR